MGKLPGLLTQFQHSITSLGYLTRPRGRIQFHATELLLASPAKTFPPMSSQLQLRLSSQPTSPLQTFKMQVAEILSDITSLRVCVRVASPTLHYLPKGSGYGSLPTTLTRANAPGGGGLRSWVLNTTNIPQGQTEALALVNVHKNIAPSSSPDKGDISTQIAAASASPTQLSKTEDLRRAKELVQLHYDVKSRHANGEVDDALRRAREDVEYVMRALS